MDSWRIFCQARVLDVPANKVVDKAHGIDRKRSLHFPPKRVSRGLAREA